MSVKPRTNLILDCAILVVFLLTMLSGFALDANLDSTELRPAQTSETTPRTGIQAPAAHVHVGTSITFLALIVIHHVVHGKWIASQIRQIRGSARRRSRVLES